MNQNTPEIKLYLNNICSKKNLKNFFKCLFLRDRERQRMSRGGVERARETQYEAGSRLQAVSTEPNEGLEPTSHEIMT